MPPGSAMGASWSPWASVRTGVGNRGQALFQNVHALCQGGHRWFRVALAALLDHPDISPY
jgi:hypothetical protein